MIDEAIDQQIHGVSTVGQQAILKPVVSRIVGRQAILDAAMELYLVTEKDHAVAALEHALDCLRCEYGGFQENHLLAAGWIDAAVSRLKADDKLQPDTVNDATLSLPSSKDSSPMKIQPVPCCHICGYPFNQGTTEQRYRAWARHVGGRSPCDG